MSDAQLRKTPRLPVSLPVIYKTETSPEVPVKCFDMSEEGICIPVKGTYDAGEKISLSIAIPDEESINCKGEIRWAREGRAGLSFADVPEGDKEKLAGFLDSLQSVDKLQKLGERINHIELTLCNLKGSVETVDESTAEVMQLFEDSEGKITEEIRIFCAKVTSNMAILRAIGKIKEKLTGELAAIRKEFQELASTEVGLKQLAICKYQPSPHLGSFCGTKYVALSRGEEWAEEKCKQCVLFRNW